MKNYNVNKFDVSLFGENRSIDICISIGFVAFAVKMNEKGQFSFNVDTSYYKRIKSENKTVIEEIEKATETFSGIERTKSRCYVQHLRDNMNDPKKFEQIYDLFKNGCPNIYKKMTEPEVKEETKAEEEIKKEVKPTGYRIKRIQKSITIHNKNK